MSHDPERETAAYLGGVMRARRRTRFERHLLECEDCWREVDTARLGRGVAESARELAPQQLRERVRAALAATAPERRRARWPLAVAASVVVIASAFAAVRLLPQQPAPIAQAVADFREGRLPGETASAPAPDLSAIGLELAASGSGSLHGLAVDAYAYRATDGDRVLLYLSEEVFPVARGARQRAPDGPWRASSDGIELLCAQEPHALLALSDDAALLHELGDRLAIEGIPA